MLWPKDKDNHGMRNRLLDTRKDVAEFNSCLVTCWIRQFVRQIVELRIQHKKEPLNYRIHTRLYIPLNVTIDIVYKVTIVKQDTEAKVKKFKSCLFEV